jgi:hypothetical protein
MISNHFELDSRVREQTKAIADLLRDRNLPLCGDLHSITPTGKCNTARSRIVARVQRFGITLDGVDKKGGMRNPALSLSLD